MTMILSMLFLVVLNFQIIFTQYIIPRPSFDILHPKGFTVRIPDNGKIRQFAFHGQINKEFDGREAGTFNSRDIIQPINGFWTFTDTKFRLQVGDTIYYWLYVVDSDGLEYVRENESYQVTSLPGNNKNKNKGNNGNRGNGNNGNQGNGNNKNPTYPVYPTIPTNPTNPTRPKPPIEPPTTPSICNETPTKVNGASSCSGRLIFSEEFNDINKWQTEVRFAGEPDYEFVTYINDPDNLYLKDGIVHFQPIFADDKYEAGFVRSGQGLDLNLNCTASNEYDCKRKPFGSNILPPVFSSRINSKPSLSFLYGKVEIKAKLPKGDWIYPELYLTPKKFSYGSGFNSGEIRVAFALGNANLNRELTGGLILGDDDTGRNYAIKKLFGNENWGDNFHVFGLEWRPDRVTLSVDGNLYGNIYPPPGGYGAVYESESSEKWKQGDILAPFDQEMIITLGVGVGGHSIPDIAGKPYKNQDAKEMLQFYLNKNTYLPSWQDDNELKIDYVKVYAL